MTEHHSEHAAADAESSKTPAAKVVQGSFAEGNGLPDFLEEWDFMRIKENDDPEAIALRASLDDEGPSIVINPLHVCREDLEHPDRILFWISPIILHLCHAHLLECTLLRAPIGRFTSPRWEMFRKHAMFHMKMSWEEILEATGREGTDFIAEHMATCILDESGLQDRIFQMVDKRRRLRIA